MASNKLYALTVVYKTLKTSPKEFRAKRLLMIANSKPYTERDLWLTLRSVTEHKLGQSKFRETKPKMTKERAIELLTELAECDLTTELASVTKLVENSKCVEKTFWIAVQELANYMLGES